jgi:hypothetical protein
MDEWKRLHAPFKMGEFHNCHCTDGSSQGYYGLMAECHMCRQTTVNLGQIGWIKSLIINEIELKNLYGVLRTEDYLINAINRLLTDAATH